MRSLIGLLAGLAALWLSLSGHYTPLLLGFGVLSCAFTAFICHRMNIIGPTAVPVHLLTRLPGYMIWLAGAIAVSNWDVIKRVVRPGRWIAPTMLTIEASQHSDLGEMIFANSITLTPGTVTVELTGSELTVHALTEAGTDEMENGDMNRRVHKLEGSTRGDRSG